MEWAGEPFDSWGRCELDAVFAGLQLETASTQEAIRGSRGGKREIFMENTSSGKRRAARERARDELWHEFKKSCKCFVFWGWQSVRKGPLGKKTQGRAAQILDDGLSLTFLPGEEKNNLDLSRLFCFVAL